MLIRIFSEKQGMRVESLIKNKKKIFFENKLKENIGKPKRVMEGLK